MDNLSPSPACVDLIKHFEGCKLRAYLCPAKVPTIGYGATGPDIEMGMTWTQAQADARIKADVERFAIGVRKLLVAKTTQGEFDALVSFAFNLGLGALRGSTLLKLHNAAKKGAASVEFAKWVNAGGRKLEGLVRRRAAEAAMYRS